MLIKSLVENVALTSEFESEHGLSLYIETTNHKVLFDLGQSGLFLRNAKKLNVNIEDVDTVVISHGHNDHGGAIDKFLEVNHKAKIYIQEKAFETHLSIHENISRNIGLDPKFKNHPQVVLINGDLKIDDELYIFNKLETHDYIAKSNSNLFKIEDGININDDFIHEQNLIIKDKNKTLLIAGCAHRGIVNIERQAFKILGYAPNVCIGGFHLSSPRTGKHEPKETIDQIAKELLKFDTLYYTCHCTGLLVYDMMKSEMHEKLNYFSVGSALNI